MSSFKFLPIYSNFYPIRQFPPSEHIQTLSKYHSHHLTQCHSKLETSTTPTKNPPIWRRIRNRRTRPKFPSTPYSPYLAQHLQHPTNSATSSNKPTNSPPIPSLPTSTPTLSFSTTFLPLSNKLPPNFLNFCSLVAAGTST